VLLQAWRGLGAWGDMARLFGAVRAPTLLIWGEHDRIYGLKAAERLRHMLPGAQLVTLDGAGHLLPVERPAELAAAMRQFLAPALRQPGPQAR
jgi:pimeloyl-ACP methyl ester carboxylesterase